MPKAEVLRVRLIADGAGQVRAEMAGVEKSFGSLEKTSGSLSKSLGGLRGVFGLLSGAAIAGAVKSSLSFADSIDKAAKAAGVGAEFLQELRFAGEQLGVSNQQVDEGFRRFTRRLGEFVNSGGGPAKKAIEDLGVSITDVQGNFRGTEAVFDDFVAKLQGMSSDAERSAYAAQLFGDDAGPKLALLLNEGAEGIEAYRRELREMGGVLSDDVIASAVSAQDQLAKLSTVMRAQFSTALVELAPLLENFSNNVLRASRVVADFFDGFRDVSERTNLRTLRDDLDEVNAQIIEVTERLNRPAGRGQLSRAKSRELLADLVAQRDALAEQIRALESSEKATEEVGKAAGAAAPAVAALGKASKDSAKGAKEARDAYADLATQLERENDELTRQLDATRESVEAGEAVADTLKTENELRAKGIDLTTEYGQTLLEAAEENNALKREIEDTAQAHRDVAQAAKDAAREQRQAAANAAAELAKPFENAIRGIQDSFTDGFREMLDGNVKDFEDFGDTLLNIFKQTLAEMATLAIAKPIIVPVVQTLAGGLGIPGAGGALGSQFSAAGGGFAGGFALSPLGAAGLAGAGGLLGGYALTGSTAGALGGGFGGVAGGLGGVLLASGSGGTFGAAVGGTLGSAAPVVGTAIGAAAGAIIADKLFGPGKDKQKIGFENVATGGIVSAFGGINVTAAANLNERQLIDALVSLDSTIAQLLTASQVGQVSAGLVGTGQFRSRSSFSGQDTFEVVYTRLERIFDSLALGGQFDALASGIERTEAGIQQLTEATVAFLAERNALSDMANELAGITEPATGAAKALEDLQTRFEGLQADADRLGFGAELDQRLLEGHARQIELLREQFSEGITDAITGILDPMQAALNDFADIAQQRLEDAQALGLETFAVEQLNQLQRQQIIEQFNGSVAGTTDQLLRTLASLQTFVSPLSDVEQALYDLQTTFATLTQQAYALGAGNLVPNIYQAQVAAVEQVRREFVDNIAIGIARIENPLQAALAEFDALADQRLADARKLGIDLTDVYRLNALERQQVIEQFAQAANDTLFSLSDTIADFADRELIPAFESVSEYLQSLSLSDLSTLNPLERLSEAQGQFDQLVSDAFAGDLDAVRDLSGAASNLLGEARDIFAGTEQYKDIFSDVTQTLENILGSAPDIAFDPVVNELQAMGEYLTTDNAEIINLLRNILSGITGVSENNDLLKDTLDRLEAAA